MAQETKKRAAKKEPSGDPCRDLISSILCQAITDVHAGHDVAEAITFLESAEAAEYAEWLDLPEDTLRSVVVLLRKRYNIPSE